VLTGAHFRHATCRLFSLQEHEPAPKEVLMPRRATATLLCLLALVAGCGTEGQQGAVITFPASAVGKEAEVLRRQFERFHALNPDLRASVQLRRTPDASDQRHQLYVQWLNARASDPDILQLDVVWTPEFAAAGWVLPLDSFRPDVSDFFPQTVRANRWQ